MTGGRIRTYRSAGDGAAIELGAQVIHGDRNPLRDLTGRAVPVAESPRSQAVPRTTSAWLVLHDRVTPLGGLARGGMPPWAVEYRLVADGCDGEHPDVAVESWLASRQVAGDHLVAASEWFRQNWAADPAALSARGVAAARRGDDTGDGEFKYEGGYQALTQTLAAGADIRLRQPVRTVTWSPGQVEVTTEAGERATARAVVITAPPPVLAGGTLSITPMPEPKASAARALPSGDGLCAVVTLARPVPESAVVFDADGQTGFVRCTAGRPEVLIVAKASAAGAVRTAGPADQVTRLFPRLFPRQSVPEIAGVRIADWGRDPWSAGVFSYPGLGVGWAGPAWAAPVERTLFFAGEATTAGSRPPTVHGALDSGLRAASEVVEAWGL